VADIIPEEREATGAPATLKAALISSLISSSSSCQPKRTKISIFGKELV
jgi:hypothetical protein